MLMTRISPKRQITIPKDVFDKLHLEVGDFLEVAVTEEGVLLVPQKVISRDQAWFWTKEWQDKEREAEESISRGELTEEFDSADGLVRHLRRPR